MGLLPEREYFFRGCVYCPSEASERAFTQVLRKKRGKVLSVEAIHLVKIFYKKDCISRIMSCLKYCIYVKQGNGKWEHVQKILLLGNLIKVYYSFQKDYEHVKIGLTKFMRLRPPHCVLTGTSGTHNVCVCGNH